MGLATVVPPGGPPQGLAGGLRHAEVGQADEQPVESPTDLVGVLRDALPLPAQAPWLRREPGRLVASEDREVPADLARPAHIGSVAAEDAVEQEGHAGADAVGVDGLPGAG